MLYFRVFVDIHSSRSLDSFPGLTPFPCLQFANSFDCHTSENSLVSPAIATDPKTHVSNPFICHTSDPPGGIPLRFSPLAKCSSCCRYDAIVCGPPHYFSLCPIPFLFTFLRTFLRFFALDKDSTLLFSIDSALFAKNSRGWGMLVESSTPSAPALPRRTQRGPGVTKSARLPSQPSTVDCQPPLRRSSAGRGTRVTSHQSLPSTAPQCYHSEET